ncbi:MAG: hypothetical protein DRR06_14475 [Gammaproteobacteria bacterium]|nr:MAG: hypothetical protein DRR06_14475 [Gammaproteobacteria bacterium]
MSTIEEISLMVDTLEADNNDLCDHEMEHLDHRTWCNAEGTIIGVSEMSHNQIRSCMRHLRGHNLKIDVAANMWLEVFELELSDRQAIDPDACAPRKSTDRRRKKRMGVVYELTG